MRQNKREFALLKTDTCIYVGSTIKQTSDYFVPICTSSLRSRYLELVIVEGFRTSECSMVGRTQVAAPLISCTVAN